MSIAICKWYAIFCFMRAKTFNNSRKLCQIAELNLRIAINKIFLRYCSLFSVYTGINGSKKFGTKFSGIAATYLTL